MLTSDTRLGRDLEDWGYAYRDASPLSGSTLPVPHSQDPQIIAAPLYINTFPSSTQPPPTMASTDDLIPLIYHEKQEPGSMLCAQHALNSLLRE